MNTHKAQAALEFMVLFGFFAAAFILVSVTLVDRQVENAQLKKSEIAKESCLILRDEINAAASFGDGYWRSAQLKKALQEPYRARVRKGTADVLIGEGTGASYYACSISAGEVEGQPADSDGIVVEFGKMVNITNRNGVVFIEQ
jgi:hypothetical protein